MTRTSLIEWTQARMDEIRDSAGVVSSSVIPPDVIAQELDEAAKLVLRKAVPSIVFPAAKMYNEDPCLVRQVDGKNVSVIIPLPADFLRFLSLKLDEWLAYATSIIEYTDPLYRAQGNLYWRQRNGGTNPLVVAIPFVTTRVASDSMQFTQALECFPAPGLLGKYYVDGDFEFNDAGDGMLVIGNATRDLPRGTRKLVRELMILRVIPAEQVPDVLLDAMVWYATHRALTILREFRASESALQQYMVSGHGLLIGISGEQNAGQVSRQGSR